MAARLRERFVRARGRAEAGGFEVEGLEDFAGDEIFPGDAGLLFDHGGGDGGADVRVGILLAGRIVGFVGEHFQHFVAAGAGAFGAGGGVLGVDFWGEDWRSAGGVGEQLGKGDRFPVVVDRGIREALADGGGPLELAGLSVGPTRSGGRSSWR